MTHPSERTRNIIRGDIVQRRYVKGMSKHKAAQLGVVGYSSYSIGLSQVIWERRTTHDIVKKDQLTVVLTKKQAKAVRKLPRL